MCQPLPVKNPGGSARVECGEKCKAGGIGDRFSPHRLYDAGWTIALVDKEEK